jgi:tRNA modification GTPase
MGSDVQDEVVLAVKELQPVLVAEIHCHGGIEAASLLIETVARFGVKERPWQERARWAGPGSDRADAFELLADAPTVRTAGVLLDQYHGAFRRALDAIREAWDRGADHDAGRLLEGLARQVPLGRHLTMPWRVVVAGAPNVGKSSLVNAIAGYQRCIVAPTPGTTRDLVRTIVAIDGWPIELADTAGIRSGAEDLEHEGITLAQHAARAADLCLWILDSSEPPIWPAFESSLLRLVVNKTDLPCAWNLDQAKDAIRVSARTGAGIAELCQAISGWLVPDPPNPGAAVPYTPGLCSVVADAWSRYSAGHRQGCLLALQQTQAEIG